MSTIQNFILRALDPGEQDRLTAASGLQQLVFREILLWSGELVETVIFPEDGVISLITQAADGTQAEAAVIGNEGAAGLIEALGSGAMSTEAVVQAAGTGWFVPAPACHFFYENSSRFRRATAMSAEFQALEARQSMLCRSFHVAEARLARWLLEMRDKSGGHQDHLPLTQEFLALMLGVQRTTVSTLAHEMQAQGLIRFSRGLMELRDIPGLEARACACRQEIKGQHQRIMRSRPAAPNEFPPSRPRYRPVPAQ